MAIVEVGIPIPPKPIVRKPVARKVSPAVQEIYDTLAQLHTEGMSFTVPGNFKAVAMVAGRFAKTLGFSVTTRQDGDLVRVWRVALKAAKPKKTAAAVA